MVSLRFTSRLLVRVSLLLWSTRLVSADAGKTESGLCYADIAEGCVVSESPAFLTSILYKQTRCKELNLSTHPDLASLEKVPGEPPSPYAAERAEREFRKSDDGRLCTRTQAIIIAVITLACVCSGWVWYTTARPPPNPVRVDQESTVGGNPSELPPPSEDVDVDISGLTQTVGSDLASGEGVEGGGEAAEGGAETVGGSLGGPVEQEEAPAEDEVAPATEEA